MAAIVMASIELLGQSAVSTKMLTTGIVLASDGPYVGECDGDNYGLDLPPGPTSCFQEADGKDHCTWATT